MPKCPKCDRTLLRSHDTGWCIVHGTVVEPDSRAWDLVENDDQGRRPLASSCGECGLPLPRATLCVGCAEAARQRAIRARRREAVA
jgi:uncharacterized Zn finger protein (UPF0148 family)